MKTKSIGRILCFLVGVLLVTTYTVLICIDALIGPMLIKEIISSACVGMCIGKLLWTIERKLKEQERKKLEEDIKRLLTEMEDKADE